MGATRGRHRIESVCAKILRFLAELRQPNASPVLRGRWRGRAGGDRFYAAFLLAKKNFTHTASSYGRPFGSERAEGIEKRGNFAGTGGRRDSLSGVGQAERKRNGFSFGVSQEVGR